MIYSLKDRGETPIYLYLYDRIKSDILNGVLQPGERLPSKRSFAQAQGVGIVTVENAYACLLAEGYIESVEKKGYFVSRIERVPASIQRSNDYSLPSKPSYCVDLRGGQIGADEFPVTVWRRLSRKVITEHGEDLFRPCAVTGSSELRRAIADYLRKTKSIETSPDCIVICAGTEMLLYSVVRLLGGHNIYAVEEPGYLKIPAVYSAAGARCVALPSDDSGVDIGALRSSGAQILHISPNHQYPTGRVTTAARRSELLSWASEKPDRYIVEDDYDSELRLDARPLGSMFAEDKNGSVIYMNTFSKTISPSLRIGYLVLPPHLMDRYMKKSEHFSCTVSTAEQLTLAEFIAGGFYDSHIGRMRKRYKLKRKEILELIERGVEKDRTELIENSAGLHFILKLNTEIGENEIRRRSEEAGIGVSFLSDCCRYPAPERNDMMIVNYAGLDSAGLETLIGFLNSLPPADKE